MFVTSKNKFSLTLGHLSGAIESFQDKAYTFMHKKAKYEITSMATFLGVVPQVSHYFYEDELEKFEKLLSKNISKNTESSIPSIYDANITLGRLCYALCRLMRPKVVIETGVAHGITSAYSLNALDINKQGKLYSVDLPPSRPHAEKFVGAIIPDTLKIRWQLSVGTSRSVLPKLAKKMQPVDLFLHDSLHTYKNMFFEFNTIYPYLVRNSVLLSDDVEANDAFVDWATKQKSNNWFVIENEKDTRLTGVVFFGPPAALK